jgi:DNA-binding PadR family transcriptional regulator
MQHLPKQTASIFEKLSRGHFINSNSVEAQQRERYAVIENHFDELAEYFSHIGFRLEQGDEYFYFSRQEDKVSIERKLQRAFKWIDIVDFFTTFNNSFAPGFRFSPGQITEEIKVNGLLSTKLQELGKDSSSSSQEQVQKLIEQLEREGFVEKVEEFYDTYKVMASFHYLENLVMAINIPEDELENENEAESQQYSQNSGENGEN